MAEAVQNLVRHEIGCQLFKFFYLGVLSLEVPYRGLLDLFPQPLHREVLPVCGQALQMEDAP